MGLVKPVWDWSVSAHPTPAVRNSPGVETVREGFQEEMTVHGSQRMKWPEKSVKSIPGRRLEACNSTAFGVSAKSCELRTGNAVWEGVGGESGKGTAQDLDSTLEVDVCRPSGSSSLPRTLCTSPSTWSAPVSCLPMFLNSGFHHRNLPLLLSQILPLCQQAGALSGNLPGPESQSQTPAASKLGKYPVAVLSPTLPAFPSTQDSALSPSPCFQAWLHRHSLSHLYTCPLWLTISDPQNPLTCTSFSLLLGLFITREPRIPFSKCLLIA